MSTAKKKYEFQEDAWFLGSFYKKGEMIELHDEQAAHSGETLRPVKAAKARPAAKQPAK